MSQPPDIARIILYFIAHFIVNRYRHAKLLGLCRQLMPARMAVNAGTDGGAPIRQKILIFTP
jgi:hypothetical protein